MQHTKTKVWTRLSLAALAVVLLAGVFAGGVLVRANVDAQDGAPEPRRTAYVDFLSLLKSDNLLRGKQQEKSEEMQREMDSIDKSFGLLVQEQQRIRELNKPDTIAYRQAMNKQLDLERQRYQQKLMIEQLTQADLRDFAIERFRKLRNLAADIAKAKGYNEVLNIVRNIEEVAAGQNDFQALQQQLLVSPVLYYESAHDITDAVKSKAEEIWGETISFAAWDAEKKTGGIAFAATDPNNSENPSVPVARNAEGEIEVRLGQSGSFSIVVLDKGEPAKDKRARVTWSRRGVNVGELETRDGAYTAPAEAPPGGATFTITVRSTVDPTVSEQVVIRLLDKDGKRLPDKED